MLIKYSSSRIKKYDSCPLQYKKHYLDKIRPKQPKTSDTEFGGFFHKAAEIYTGGNNKEIVKLTRDYELNADYKRLIIPSLNNFKQFYEKYDKFKTTTEQEWEWKTDDIWLMGIVDLLIETNKGLISVDYKTARSSNRDRHIFQMRLYNLIISKTLDVDPKEVKCIIYYPRPNIEDKFLFSNKEIQLFERDLRNKIDKIETTKVFESKEGYHCRWCPYFNTENCPSTKGKTL